MTALEYFEKLKSFGQLDENANYQEWIDERIKKQYPVEGNLLEAYKNASTMTIGRFSDYRRIEMASINIPLWTKEQKNDEPTKVQVRFIRKIKNG